MQAAGIQEEFESLCAKAGLTRLANCRVTQYEKLTSYFINSFRYYPDDDTVEFRFYGELLTMSMSRFCEALGLPDAGKKAKMSSQPTELWTPFDSFCSQDTRDLHRHKISSILFPHLGYFAYFIARGVLARDNMSNTSSPDTAIMANALSGKHEYHVDALIARRLAANGNKGDLFGGVYATLIL